MQLLNSKKLRILLFLLILILALLLAFNFLVLNPKLKNQSNNIPPFNTEAVSSDIKTAFTNNPNAVYGHLDQTLALNFWKYCQKGDPSIPGSPDSNKEFNCETLISLMYQDEYKRLNDTSFKNIAKQVYDYAVKNLPSNQVEILKKNIINLKIEF